MTATPLLDRIHPERRTESLTPLVERRGGDERRLPTWVTRMQQGKLAGKDMTGRIAA